MKNEEKLQGNLNDNDILVKLSQKGDVRAINKLCQVNKKYIYNILYFKSKNRALIEDLTQEVLIKMITNLNQYSKTEYKFETWLSSIINSVFVDNFRKSKNSPENNLNFVIGLQESGSEKEYSSNYIHDSLIEKESVEDKYINGIEKENEKNSLKKAISNLDSEIHKKVMCLYLFSELKYDKIAEKTGLSNDNVKVIIFRAKKEITKYIINQNSNELLVEV